MESKNKTILVIDNDDAVLEILSERLQARGYDCLTASTGTQGLAAFQSGNPDLVITDLNMPGYDGIALAETIRNTSQVPIILMTAYPTSYQGCFDHLTNAVALTKPFAWSSLLSLLESEFALAS